MAPIRKYEKNAENRFCCPNCPKTFKSQSSCSNHFIKFHKVAPVVITIPDSQPMPTPAQSPLVTRREFDELKAQYQTIIDMLTTMTSANKPTVQTCEISTQTEEEVVEVVEVVEEVKEVEVVEEVQEPIKEVIEEVKEVEDQPKKVVKQPKAKATKQPKMTDEEKLHSHTYFSQKEDGTVVFRCIHGVFPNPERLILHYKMRCNEVITKTKWAVALDEKQLTEEQVDELQKVELATIEADKSNFKSFEAIHKKLKKSQPKETKTPAAKVIKPTPQKKENDTDAKYEEAVNNLQSHPYFSHKTEDGKHVFKCIFGEYINDKIGNFINYYQEECDKVAYNTKWTQQLINEELTEEQVKAMQKKAKEEIRQDSSNFAKFQTLFDRLKEAKKKCNNKQSTDEDEVEQVDDEVEQVQSVEFREREDHAEFLLECCRTLKEDGFAKAYHYMNDPSKLHFVKKETKQGTIEVYDPTTNKSIMKPHMVKSYKLYKDGKCVPTKLCYIREELEDIYITLHNAWKAYCESCPPDENMFNVKTNWLDVCQDLVTAENIDTFCH
jgi:hypothetical protein